MHELGHACHLYIYYTYILMYIHYVDVDTRVCIHMICLLLLIMSEMEKKSDSCSPRSLLNKSEVRLGSKGRTTILGFGGAGGVVPMGRVLSL